MGLVMRKIMKCSICEAELNKNVVALNKKLFGEKVAKLLCMNCLSAHLDTSVEDLFAKIEDFKMQGCTLFD
jgi:hypothetical protein